MLSYRSHSSPIKMKFTLSDTMYKTICLLSYTLMFFSLYVFFQSDGNSFKEVGLFLFVVQLMLNFLWSPILFYCRKIIPACIISAILNILIVLMMLIFSKVSYVSALLNIPYLILTNFLIIISFKYIKLSSQEKNLC